MEERPVGELPQYGRPLGVHDPSGGTVSDVDSCRFERSGALVFADGLELDRNGSWHVTDKFQQMGIFDWKGHDVRLHQVTPAMWHSTPIATWLVPRILELESKVVDTFSGSVCELMKVFLSMTSWRLGCTPRVKSV